jgi:16S rRNA (guanine527-N7)-methyltransferase
MFSEHFPELTPHQLGQFGQLQELYAYWNERINLISRRDMEQFEVHHVLHSLAIGRVQPFLPNAQVMDAGTGGGFPGVPLAILFPETDFLLVDSIGKKIKVVREVCSALQLKNVRAEQKRIEQVGERFDFVVSRAVTRMAPFSAWVKGKFLPESRHNLTNGILYLKGGDLQEELDECRRTYRIFTVSDFFYEEYFLTKQVVHMPMLG